MAKDQFFNRELSWIEFNFRVLEEALEKDKPLLERLKFLAIFFSNLDEFVMVRVSGLVSLLKSGKIIKDPSGITPDKLLIDLQKRINETTKMAYNCLNKELLPALEKENFYFYTSENIPEMHLEYLKKIFTKKYYFIITPMAIDQSRPFPFLAGKSINILVELKDPKKNNKNYAIIPVPTNQRFIKVSDNEDEQKYIYIEEFIKLHLNLVFKGFEILQTCSFRITRDSELTIDEEDAIDLLSAIEDQLKQRAKGYPIRLEIESIANKKLVDYLFSKIDFYNGYYFPIKGPLDITSFFEIVSKKGYENLKDKNLMPVSSKDFFYSKKSIFDIINHQDRILHLPFESFEPVSRFFEEASTDKNVLAIKITLYRTSGDSPIIRSLKRAAENGKQVTVLVELKARFDEAQNINWAKQLEKSGCHVVYGLVGLKIHSKMALVIREEKSGIKQYIHLSTGNYNDKTAKIYTDIGLFTSKKTYGRDVSAIFNLLTGFSEPPRWNKLICAPLDLRDFFLEKIEVEIKNVVNGGKGKIIAKLNSLIDIKIIKALYKASNTGVKIELIVRGMNRLKPGIKGLSENISIISIVDQFLEHSRIYYFYNSGEEDIYLSSADWMERNLDRRVETLFPIEEKKHKDEILYYLKFILSDNVKSRILQPDGIYIRKRPKKNEKLIHYQKDYYKYILEKNKKSEKKNQIFIPKTKPESIN